MSSVVEFLGLHHDRKAFDCGKDPLNRFLRDQARQNADRFLGATQVVVPAPGESSLQGYFTLVTRTVEGPSLPEKRLPRGPVGVVLLGQMAVDRRCPGQGLGRRMLLRAMAETEHAAARVGLYALVLDALDSAALDWYLKLDFGLKPLPDHPSRLYVPVTFIRQLHLGPLTADL